MKNIDLKGGVSVPVKSSSSQWSLNIRDFIQGGITAAIGSVAFVLQQALDAGHFVFDYKVVGMAAFSGLIGYLIRKFPQSGKVVIEKKEIEEAKK